MRRLGFLITAAVLASALLPTAASACNKNFYVYDRASLSIARLYVAPTAVNNWEDDVLSNTTAVQPNTSRLINMKADTRSYTLYDVRAILSDGTKVTGGQINMCLAHGVYVYGGRITYSNH